ncbi:hypothetical protein PanWU01x14_143610 [Parasponia andersonii]|uniref:Uncharacterized protein n=1 Tax=Parasponia andersonii TaxID=3476 RepID=A0A2P5CKX6_PARAD|nr:hypothetical protein PanWU01x14_143610 [Parasponia andersonii]
MEAQEGTIDHSLPEDVIIIRIRDCVRISNSGKHRIKALLIILYQKISSSEFMSKLPVKISTECYGIQQPKNGGIFRNPSPPSESQRRDSSLLSFGYDHDNNDYKLVRVELKAKKKWFESMYSAEVIILGDKQRVQTFKIKK